MYRLITQRIAEKIRRDFYTLIYENDGPAWMRKYDADTRVSRYRNWVWDRYGMSPASVYLVWSQAGDIYVAPTGNNGFDWRQA